MNFEFVDIPEDTDIMEVYRAHLIKPIESSPFLDFIKQHDLVPIESIPEDYRLFEKKYKDWLRTEVYMKEIPSDWIHIHGDFGCTGVYQDPKTAHVWAIYRKSDHFLGVMVGKGTIMAKKEN